MKKSKILMLLPAFLLVGCSSNISSEEASKRAEEITKKQAELGSPKQLKVELKQTDEGKTEESVFEFDLDNNFYYLQNAREEAWFYKGDEEVETWYQVEHTYASGEEPEGKGYTTVTGSFIAPAKAEVEQLAAMPKYYASTLPAISEYEAADSEGNKATVKYSSKGEGNLKVEVSGTTKHDGKSCEITAEFEWDNYRAVHYFYKSVIDGVESSTDAKISYSVSVHKPNLSEYTPFNA